MTKRVLASLAGASAALLSAVSWAQPQNQTNVWIVAPQNRVQVIEPRRPEPPSGAVMLSSVSSTATIDDQVASTTIVLTLKNMARVQQEAQVILPVPAGASVRSFQLDSAGDEPTAKILPREEARRIYDAIVAASRDPGLLEFAGFGALKSSVFPVPANGTQTVRITYEVMLPADSSSAGTRVDYVLPRTESLQASGAAWSFGGEIRSRRPIASVYSPSHEVEIERVGPGHVKIKATKSAGASGTLRVSYLLEAEKGEGLASSLLMYPDPGVGGGNGGYFMLLGGFPPRDANADERTAMLREVTIVLDRSGSMRGEKIEQAREGALQMLEGLKEGEYFNIIDYSDSIASFAETPVKKDAESIARARGYLKDLQANGGTNIHDALVEALRQKPTSGTLPVVLFLTDGLPTVGMTRETDIRDGAEKANTHERRIFTFGVGVDVNSPLLSRLADVTRGAPTFVLPGEDVEVKVSQVFRRLSGPVFAGMKLRGEGIREILPRNLPDIFEGDQVIILGQYTGGQATRLVLSGNYLGEKKEFVVSIDPAAASVKNSYVPRMWATRMVGELLDQIRQASTDGANAATDPKTKELVDEIVRLSTKWGVLTEYTAFLVQEPPGTVQAWRDGVNRPAEPMAPAAEAGPQLRARLEERTQERSGGAGVSQDMNLYHTKSAGGGKGAMAGAPMQQRVWFDENLNRVEAKGMQMVSDRTFLWRNNRWVDSRAVDQEQEKPDRVVEFGSEEYSKLVDELLKQDLQGVMGLLGDVLVMSNGERVLIKMPS